MAPQGYEDVSVWQTADPFFLPSSCSMLYFAFLNSLDNSTLSPLGTVNSTTAIFFELSEINKMVLGVFLLFALGL